MSLEQTHEVEKNDAQLELDKYVKPSAEVLPLDKVVAANGSVVNDFASFKQG